MERNLTREELKEYLNLKFKEKAFLDSLYRELELIIVDKQTIPKLTADQLCNIIIDKGLLDKLLTQSSAERAIIGKERTGHDPFKPVSKDKTPIRETTGLKFYDQSNLQLTVFLEEIRNFNFSKEDGSYTDKDLQVCVTFLEERMISSGVPLSKTMRFLQNLRFDFKGILKTDRTTMSRLLLLKSPLRFTVLTRSETTGKKEVLCVKDIEWRYILAHKKLTLNVELPYIKDRQVSVGILRVELNLRGKGEALGLVDEKVLEAQLDKEKETVALKIKEFFDFSEDWWTEYKHLHPHFAHRAVKIYAEDLYGSLKPVCHFLQKMQCRALCSPEEASRFVSLIPFLQKPLEKETQWRGVHSFLTEGAGNAIDHALLLCSLLLGFKMDAYICLGSSTDGAHAWVLTRGEQKVGKTVKKTHKFWESLTGKIFSTNDPRVNYLYRRVGCVFNHKTLYANLQEDDLVTKFLTLRLPTLPST